MKKENLNWTLKAIVWLVLMTVAIILLSSCATTSYYPFVGQTKCKPIKRMTQQQVRQAQLGNNLYIRCNGRQVKNSMKIQQYLFQNRP